MDNPLQVLLAIEASTSRVGIDKYFLVAWSRENVMRDMIDIAHGWFYVAAVTKT